MILKPISMRLVCTVSACALILMACGGAASSTPAANNTAAATAPASANTTVRTTVPNNAVATVAATSAAPAASGDKVTLKFVGWGGPEEKQVFQKLVDSFNAANPNTQVQYTQIPDDYVTKLKTMIAGGARPDIAYIPDGDFSSFAPKDTLVDIQALVDKSTVIKKDDIWASALDRYRYDSASKTLGKGDLYALPKDIGPTVLTINKDMFKKANVPLPDPNKPMTWDQVIDVGQKLTVDKNGKHPNEAGFDVNNVVQYGVGDLWMEDVVYGNGGKIVSDDGKKFVMADDPNSVAGIQFMEDITHKYHIHPTAQQTTSQDVGSQFSSGKLGMTTCGRWCVTGYRTDLKFDWDVVPNPVGPSGTVYARESKCTFSGWSGSVGIAMLKGSNAEKFADRAYQFLEYISGPQGQTQQAALGFQIPNQPSVAKTDAFLQPSQKPQNSNLYLEAARCEWAGPWTKAFGYNEWFDANFWQGVNQQSIVEGKMSAADAFKQYAPKFQPALDTAIANVGK